MNDLIDTTEMYLRTIYELQEEGVPPLRARLVERLDQSGPTVSQTVARMQRDGLLRVGEDRQILLTATGQQLAARVMRKHRLAECLLVDVLGVPWDQVHAEACRWEHVISNSIEERILAVVGNPTVSPFGNPIPALADLGADGSRSAIPPARPEPQPDSDSARSLSTAATTDRGQFRVLRIEEAGQTDENTLSVFRRVGLVPDGMVDCRRRQGYIQVGRAGESADVPLDLAAHILVVPMEPADGDAPDAD